jgi:hypothetical protein
MRRKYAVPSAKIQARAANAIILRWIEKMLNGECNMKGKSIRQWLRAASKNSCVMHDNCDANMVFDHVLRLSMKLLPQRINCASQLQADIWNAVTDSEVCWLERAAKRALVALS